MVHTIYFIVAFCLTQIACNNLILKNTKSPYAHNKQFATQYHHYLKKKDQYNTVFMGSSRTYRQIVPHTIDSVLVATGIRSYNLGAHATFIPEAFFLLEMFIDSQPPDTDVKYVFMELTGINNIKMTNWFSPQSYYYLDSEILKLVLKTHFSTGQLHWLRASIYAYPYLQGYFFKNIVPLKLFKTKREPDYYTGTRGDGFYPKDLDLAENQMEKLIFDRTTFLKDTTVLQAKKIKQIKRKKEEISQVYIDYLNHLVHMADQKNIALYFIIPPKLKYYHSLESLKQQVTDQRVIDMGNYEAYPILNLAKYNFDNGHFNKDGAEIYTAYLAQKIALRLEANQDNRPASHH